MELVVFSQNGCVPCQVTKNFLNDKGVEFKEINLSEDGNNRYIEEYGLMSTPVTILFEDDEEIARVKGFDEKELDILIEQL